MISDKTLSFIGSLDFNWFRWREKVGIEKKRTKEAVENATFRNKISIGFENQLCIYEYIYVDIPSNVINKRYDLAILFLTSFIPHKKCGTPQIEEPS